MNRVLNLRLPAVLLTLLVLTAVPYLIRLGSSSLWDSNEAFYAETPREMIESGDFINPSFNYQPRFNKPPLSYWIVAFFYKVFGVSEASQRFAIAIGALSLVATAGCLAGIAFGKQAALLAAAGLAASPRFLMFSRRIMIDIYLSLFMSLALLFFVLADSRPEKRRLYLSLMYASIGLGVMTKGPVAALLPALALGAWIIFTRDFSIVRRLMLPAGILIVAVLVLPWYIAVYSQHGWTYIESFLLRDNFSRYTEQAWGPSRGIFFYVIVILGDLFPMSLLLAAAFWLALRGKGPSGSREQHVARLLVVWVSVIVVFFSLSRSKEDLYVLPAFAAAAALVGGLASRFVELKLPESLLNCTRILWAIAGVGLLIGGGLALYLFAGPDSPYFLAAAGAIGTIAVVGGTLTLIAAAINKRGVAVVSLLGALALANWVFVLKTLPDFERYKPVPTMCEQIRNVADPQSQIGYYRFASPSMTFYLQRQIFELYDPEELKRMFSTGNQVLCLIGEQDYVALQGSLPETYVLATGPVFQVKLKGILDRVLPPQVLLITNRVERSNQR